MTRCPDCNDDNPWDFVKGIRGDGKCNNCGGSGVENIWTAPVGALLGEPLCSRCGGNGVCPTCNGEGEV